MKQFIPKLKEVEPNDIMDVWRLLAQSYKHRGPEYPDMSEIPPEVLRQHLFNYLLQPGIVTGKHPLYHWVPPLLVLV